MVEHREGDELVMLQATDDDAALDRLMADARKGKFGVTAVWRFDRFGRSLRHLVTALDEFYDLGIQVSVGKVHGALAEGVHKSSSAATSRRAWFTRVRNTT
jgi:hypothetical protein